ncbi:MAG TPA: sugar ABC transporter permease, partial [Armatimonadota bacterium]
MIEKPLPLRRPRWSGRQRRDLGIALAFLLPNFLGFLVFTTWPVVFSLVVSFSNWNLQRTVPFAWIGLENFRTLLTDQEFQTYAGNTAYFMLGMPIAIAGSLFLAILLNQRLRGIIVYRTLFYLPSFTAGVALMILWKALYNPDFGPINATLEWAFRTFHVSALLGHPVTPPQWLQSTRNLVGLHPEHLGFTAQQWGLGARDAIIFMGVWTAIGGNNMLLYLAGLSNIPLELVEAAEL